MNDASTDPVTARRLQRLEDEQQMAQLREGGFQEHADQMALHLNKLEKAGLAYDVYQSAAHTGEAPPGWTRGTENPEALRALGLNLSDEQIRGMLQPSQSGFRAEIYIPDPAVLGPDAKPVLAFKGSTGPIADPNAPGAVRESAGEDYVHNFLQGMGEKSDYYDRAMDLALTLKNSGIGTGFEIAAHSLGGGMASAAATVSGVHATTFNAAGLHPNTVKRFLQENNLAQTDALEIDVTAYQVDRELLNELQTGTNELSAVRRTQLGYVASQLGQYPELKEFTLSKLSSLLPEHARGDAARLLDTLGNAPNGVADVRMPPTAGDITAVPAKMYDANNQLVDRPDIPSLREAVSMGGPLLNVLSGTVAGAKAGYMLGQPNVWAAQGVSKGLDAAGDAAEYGANIAGHVYSAPVTVTQNLMGMTVAATGESVAYGRSGLGYASAGWEYTTGSISAGARDAGAAVTGFFGFKETSQGLSQRADEIRAQTATAAQQHIQEGHASAALIRQGAGKVVLAIDDTGTAVTDGIKASYSQAGAVINATLDNSGRAVEDLAKLQRTVTTVSGGVIGGTAVAGITYNPSMPWGMDNVRQTVDLLGMGKDVAIEGVSRHSMIETVIPTMEYLVRGDRAEAARMLEERARQQEAAQSSQRETSAQPENKPISALISSPEHADYGLFRGAQAGVHAIDASMNRTSDVYSAQLSGALAAKAKEAGMPSIGHVVLGKDSNTIFAATTADEQSANFRFVSMDVMKGMNQSLGESTQQIADAQARQQTQQQQNQFQQQEENITRTAGPRMG